MKKISLAILTFFLSTTIIFAQSTTGKIVGTVTAPDGAVPGATIVITDNQTGKEKTVTATNDGTFSVPQLEFGSYTVKITAAGFKSFTATDVKIDAGRDYTLKAQLEIGQVSETVTVTAGTEQINTSNAELSSTTSREQLRELPLDGRNPLALLSLTAGANPTTDSINGQRSSSTTITRDGLNIQDNFIRTGAFVADRPTVDDTGEFTITTQNAGSQLGVGSSQVQLVTPRGSSQFHGNLYEFNRNSKFTSNTFFNNAATPPISKPFLNRNQFGGTISGPAPLFNFGEGGPTFLKNKAFFFFNYERFALATQTGITGLTTLLPTARNGNFSYIGTDGVTRTVNVLTGAGFNLTDPVNAAAFADAGGVLSVDPIIQSRLLSQLPTSGNGTTTGINFTQQLNLNRSTPVTRNGYTGRFDIDLNDRNTINFVYKHTDEQNARGDIAAGFSPNSFVNQGGPTNFFVAAYRLTPTANFSNEVRGGFQNSEPFFREGNIPTNYLISQSLVDSPEGTFRSQGRNTRYKNIQDNAVLTLGDHSLSFGGNADFYDFTSSGFGGITPTFTITSTINPNTPGLITGQLPFASATDLARANNLRYTLAGIVGSGSRTANLTDLAQGFQFTPSQTRIKYNIYSGYVQDQWRFSRSLTLNFGLRYDYFTPLEGPSGLFLEPVLPNVNDVTSALNGNGQLNLIGGNSGRKNTFFKPDKNNFAPNFSFNYSPKFENGFFAKILNNQTVIRGGFRLNYVNDEYANAGRSLSTFNDGLGSQDVIATRNGSSNLRATLSPTAGFDALPVIADTPANPTVPISFAQNNANRNFLGSVFGVDPNYKVQQNQEYNLGIQREIGFGTVIEVRYVGGRSNTASRTIDFNQIDIQNNGFLADFQKARNNCLIQGRTRNPQAFDPAFFCTSAANIGLPGQVDLPVFNNLVGGGFLNNSTVRAFIQQNRVGSLAQFYVQNGVQGDVKLQPSDDIFRYRILTNGGKYQYNSLQAEIRRRFSNGVSFQANYTFAKTLADIPGDSNSDQLRLGEFIDNNNRRLDFGRPDYDRTHTVNINAIYELPFGRGKRFLNSSSGLVDKLIGGFQVTSIINLSSGPPLSVIDPRSTFNITSASGRQTATSSLSTNEIKKLTGTFRTPNGIYIIDPKVLYATARNPTTGVTQRIDLNQPLPSGFNLVSVRAASPIDQAPFDGQVFFFNKAGSTGNLQRNFINGLPYYNWNASISKSIKFRETTRLQLRMEVFNVLNKQVPFFGADLDINSDSFGRSTESYNAPRIIQFGARFDF